MDIKKFLTGTLVGGLAFFLLGYLIFGMALESFMNEHTIAIAGVKKTMEELTWWALIAGNLSSAALLSYIFLKWASISTFSRGASAGALVGFFSILNFDMITFATSNFMDLTGVFTDVAAFTLLSALSGGTIGAVLGMGKKS